MGVALREMVWVFEESGKGVFLGGGRVLENSPALQGWGHGGGVRESRQGRQRLLSSLSGLLSWGGVGPSAEALGYFRLIPSCVHNRRDCQAGGLPAISRWLSELGERHHRTSSAPAVRPRRGRSQSQHPGRLGAMLPPLRGGGWMVDVPVVSLRSTTG